MGGGGGGVIPGLCGIGKTSLYDFLLNINCQHLRSCLDDQLSLPHICSRQAQPKRLTSTQCSPFHQ